MTCLDTIYCVSVLHLCTLHLLIQVVMIFVVIIINEKCEQKKESYCNNTTENVNTKNN